MKCSKRWLVGLVLGVAAGRPATAAEFRVSGGLWDYDVSGYQDDQGTITDLETFAPGRQRDGFLQAEYTHRPSWLPDLAVAYAQVSGEGSQTTTSLPAPLPLPIPDPTTTTTTASGDFSDVDFTARYAIALGPIRLAPGVTLSWLKGHIETSSSSATGSESSRQDYNKVVPLLHAQLTWPATEWLRLSAQGDWIKAGDNEAYQYGAAVEVQVLGPLGVYGGWHARRYKLSSSDSYLEADLRGFRYGLSIVF